MSTLTGNKISLTYKSIFKTSDNDILTAALKQMSDGFGNNSGIYLNTGGDLKSTGILEFANFKGTSTAVSINRLVNEADGISNNDNDTSLPTSAAVKDYVDTHVTTQDLDFKGDSGTGAVDLDSQLLDIAGTTNEIVTSATAQKLTIGLPNSVIISGTYTGATFLGDLNGTINTATTATTQSAGNNSTKVATTAYVDTLDAASDLDFSGTTGTGDVNLNTQSFAVTGTANQIVTAASNQGLQISLLSTGVTMPNGSIATTQSAGDNSTKLATTAYVDVLDSASDLDITDGSNTSDVNLNTQSLSILGTTNEIVSTVSDQTATISLPSTINVNVVGNVTGALTGNADTATKWQTPRNLSVSGEATGTISNVDGSVAVSGAVTLTNSAVVGKVLTGLPTPAAGNIQAADTILEAFGKVQSQINSISSGLVFKGSWDAATNTPILLSGGGEVDSGITDGATTAFKLIQSGQNFNTSVSIGNKVVNQVDGTTALVTVIDSNTQLTLDTDIMLTGEAYTIDASPFIPQGNYYVVNFAGTHPLNGINVWSIGDWVIADADNRWSKLDHSQIDGQGTIGNLPVFATATTIGDSIVAQAGTALTITGSATTTLGLSSTGNFAVNTNKFTANATTGNVVVAGILDADNGNITNNLVVNGLQSIGGAVVNQRSLAIYNSASNNELEFIGTNYTNIYSQTTSTMEVGVLGTGGDLKLSTTGGSLTINDSGNSTFTGDLTMSSGAINSKNLLFSGAAIPAANTPSINLRDTNNEIYFQSGSAHIFNFIRYDNRNSMMNLESTGINVTGGGNFSGNLVLHNTSNAPFIDFVESGATSDSKARITMDQVDTNNGQLIFSTEKAGTLTTALTISQTQNSTFAGQIIGQDSGSVQLELKRTSSGTDGNTSIKFVQPLGNGFFGVNSSGALSFGTAANLLTDNKFLVDRSGNSTFAGNVDIGGSTLLDGLASNGYRIYKIRLQAAYTGGWGSITPGTVIGGLQQTNFRTDGGASNIAAAVDFQLENNTYGTGQTNISFKCGGVNGVDSTEKMRITSEGNVGIGTESPAKKLDVARTATTFEGASTDEGAVIRLTNPSNWESGYDGNGFLGGIEFFSGDDSENGPAVFGAIKQRMLSPFNDTAMCFFTSPSNGSLTERMRIEASGQVLIRRTVDYDSSSLYCLQVGDASVDNHTPIVCTVATTSTRNQIVFSNNAGNNIGQISTGGSATSYNTSSDYRLKEDLQDFAGLDMVSKIPVYDFKWKSDKSRSYGVMAHELQEVLPQAVNGNKDAKEMQSVDYSKIVPLLLKSIQELTAKVERLEKECKCK